MEDGEALVMMLNLNDQVSCEVACQLSDCASSRINVSVQTDMSCALGSLKINKKCYKFM